MLQRLSDTCNLLLHLLPCHTIRHINHQADHQLLPAHTPPPCSRMFPGSSPAPPNYSSLLALHAVLLSENQSYHQVACDTTGMDARELRLLCSPVHLPFPNPQSLAVASPVRSDTGEAPCTPWPDRAVWAGSPPAFWGYLPKRVRKLAISPNIPRLSPRPIQP